MNAAKATAGLKILVVEDEAMIAMLIEDMLIDLGCEVIGPMSNIDKALRAASTNALDGALLDVNLRGQPVYPVADALIARGVPVVFVTGYGETGLDQRFAGMPVVSKPLPPGALEQVLTQHIAGRCARGD
jgi:CheY-like chemotaxis protein